jgi:signal transduction histidine kinase
MKHRVEGHGGTVQAESLLGAGTTIRFTLPAPDEPEGGQEETAASVSDADTQ